MEGENAMGYRLGISYFVLPCGTSRPFLDDVVQC